MKIKITIDKFSSKKDLPKFVSFNRMPTNKELFEFMGGEDFELIDRIMRKKE